MTAPSRPNSSPVALVTGGARRIGRTIALALARDGWHVAVHYASSRSDALMTVDEISALGGRAVAINRDLAVETGVRSMLAECAAELGPVGCVVNSASLFEADDADSFTGAILQRHMAVNAVAPVLLAQALHTQTMAAGGTTPNRRDPAVVINVLDQKLWNPNPDFLSYTLSKSALREATTLLAQALAPRVRVVGVAPGITLPSADQTEDEFKTAHACTPLGASSTPEDVAAAVVYLARARSVTGTTLLVDGGQHLVPSTRDIMFVTRQAGATQSNPPAFKTADHLPAQTGSTDASAAPHLPASPSSGVAPEPEAF